MAQDVWIILHGGSGQLPLLDYLYRVFVHLLAVAVVALVTRLLIGVFAAMTAGAATEPDVEKQEQ
jgi:hypothetical protein